jgi:hypothetical protein
MATTTTTAAAVAEDQPLTRHQLNIFRFDAKALVAGVVLGVVMTIINAGILERVDTALTGGTWFPLAGGTHSTLSVLSGLFFRLPAGWITGETNALFAVITGSTPVAWAFLINNAIYPIIVVLVSRVLSMRKWYHYVVLLAPAILVGYSPMIPATHSVFSLPWGVALKFQLLTDGAALVIAAVLAYLIAQAIARSRVAD